VDSLQRVQIGSGSTLRDNPRGSFRFRRTVTSASGGAVGPPSREVRRVPSSGPAATLTSRQASRSARCGRVWGSRGLQGRRKLRTHSSVSLAPPKRPSPRRVIAARWGDRPGRSRGYGLLTPALQRSRTCSRRHARCRGPSSVPRTPAFCMRTHGHPDLRRRLSRHQPVHPPDARPRLTNQATSPRRAASPGIVQRSPLRRTVSTGVHSGPPLARRPSGRACHLPSAFRPRGFAPPRRFPPPVPRARLAARCRPWGSPRFGELGGRSPGARLSSPRCLSALRSLPTARSSRCRHLRACVTGADPRGPPPFTAGLAPTSLTSASSRSGCSRPHPGHNARESDLEAFLRERVRCRPGGFPPIRPGAPLGLPGTPPRAGNGSG
jgi:hypothetical protein